MIEQNYRLFGKASRNAEESTMARARRLRFGSAAASASKAAASAAAQARATEEAIDSLGADAALH